MVLSPSAKSDGSALPLKLARVFRVIVGSAKIASVQPRTEKRHEVKLHIQGICNCFIKFEGIITQHAAIDGDLNTNFLELLIIQLSIRNHKVWILRCILFRKEMKLVVIIRSFRMLVFYCFVEVEINRERESSDL